VIKFFVILLFLLCSCAYPDIDTVPDFKDVIITEKDSIELCKINNPYTGTTKINIFDGPVPTYMYISNNYKRLECFEVLDININRYGL